MVHSLEQQRNGVQLLNEKKLIGATNDYHKLGSKAKNLHENKAYAVTVLNNKVTQNRYKAFQEDNGGMAVQPEYHQRLITRHG